MALILLLQFLLPVVLHPQPTPPGVTVPVSIAPLVAPAR